RSIRAFERKARRFGDDQKVREAAERGDDVLGDPITEELLAGITRQVFEGKNRYRRATRETSWSCEARDLDRLGRGAGAGRFPTHANMKHPGAKTGDDQHGDPCSGEKKPLPSRWPGCRGRRTQRVSTHRVGDIFDAVGSERPVIESELVPDLVVYGLRDADRAGLGERLEPGGDVDAVAKDIVAVDDHVAEIDADPQLQPTLKWDRIVDPT